MTGGHIAETPPQRASSFTNSMSARQGLDSSRSSGLYSTVMTGRQSFDPSRNSGSYYSPLAYRSLGKTNTVSGAFHTYQASGFVLQNLNVRSSRSSMRSRDDVASLEQKIAELEKEAAIERTLPHKQKLNGVILQEAKERDCIVAEEFERVAGIARLRTLATTRSIEEQERRSQRDHVAQLNENCDLMLQSITDPLSKLQRPYNLVLSVARQDVRNGRSLQVVRQLYEEGRALRNGLKLESRYITQGSPGVCDTDVFIYRMMHLLVASFNVSVIIGSSSAVPSQMRASVEDLRCSARMLSDKKVIVVRNDEGKAVMYAQVRSLRVDGAAESAVAFSARASQLDMLQSVPGSVLWTVEDYRSLFVPNLEAVRSMSATSLSVGTYSSISFSMEDVNQRVSERQW